MSELSNAETIHENSNSTLSSTIKTEMNSDIKPDVHDLHSSKKLSAVEVELQMLGPIWYEVICEANKGASDEQIKTLLDLKLDQAKQMIPARWKAEKKFKDNCVMIQQIHTNINNVLKNLQTKELNDPSVKIEDHQAKRLMKDWETIRHPAFEANFQEATRMWYKPHGDPLTAEFSTIMNQFAHLMARFEYETSIRPALNGSTSKRTSTESVIKPPDPKKMIKMDKFQVRGRIQPFEGDLGDPEVVDKFLKWKKDWECLVREMETMPGFCKIVLFQKLKSTLSGRALKMLYRYSTHRKSSYDDAMKDLRDKFENPLNIAAHHIKRGLTKRKTNLEQLDAAQDALNALQNLKHIFQREKVDMFDFALTCTFARSMAPLLESRWYHFRIQEMHDYNQKRESALKSGDHLPEWNFGMVDNYEQFDAWLRLQEALMKQSGVETNSDQRSTDLSCFLCGPHHQTHHLTRCPKGLDMSLPDWKRACRRHLHCYKCGRPSDLDHRCEVKCRICTGRRTKVNHHMLMCPLSKFRTSPVDDEDEEDNKRASEASPKLDNVQVPPNETRYRARRQESVHSSDGKYSDHRMRDRSPLRFNSSSDSRYRN